MFKQRYLKKLWVKFYSFGLMEAEFPAESEYKNQNVFLHELCLLELLKDEYPTSPKTAKIVNFQAEKSRKVQDKIFSFFFYRSGVYHPSGT